MPTPEQLLAALHAVVDPALERQVGELDLIADVSVEGGSVRLDVRLPVPDSPYQDQLLAELDAAARAVPGVRELQLRAVPIGEEQRQRLSQQLRAERGQLQPDEIVFGKPGNPTKVVAVASGKGGVGKSSVTANLAVALAGEGYDVGVMDADIYGYSIPRMLGVEGRPYGFEGLVLPLRAHGCKVISIGFFLPDPDRPVMWRGPMLHRALQQFLADVHWGDLDFLLCDLPPGTGDIAISLAQMLPTADLLVVTTPQQAAERVAARAGEMAAETGMQVGGVVENMAGFTCPDCGSTHDLFGSGGGEALAAHLGTQLLGRVPLDPRLRVGGDEGRPLVLSHPDSPAAQALRSIAADLASRARSVVGRSLPLVGA